MPRIALISDLHIMWDTPAGRLDNIVETVKGKLNFLFQYCLENNLDILCAGDVFDVPRSWRSEDLFLDILNTYPTVKFMTIRGQHDYYYRSELTVALSLLVKSKKTTMITSSGMAIFPNVYVYGCHYGEEELPLVKMVDEKTVNILVIHRMITDRPIWKGQQEFTDASWFLSQAKGYDLILVGDAHRKFLIKSSDNGRIICNTGPLLRAEATEDMYEHHPCFFVVDLDTMHIEEISIPHESAEKVLSRDHIEWTEEKDLMLDQFCASIQTNEITGVSFLDNLADFMKVNSISVLVQKIIAEEMVGEEK